VHKFFALAYFIVLKHGTNDLFCQSISCFPKQNLIKNKIMTKLECFELFARRHKLFFPN